MNDTALALALGSARITGYVGFVLVAGTLTFLAAVWPQGRRDRRLVRLAGAGIIVLAVATVAVPLVEAAADGVSVGDAVGRPAGTAALIRLAVLIALAAILPELTAKDIHRWRTGVCLSTVLVIEATIVAQSNAVGGRWEWLKIIATMGHLTAMAAWLGGLVALATVLIPRDNLADLHGILPSFAKVAMASVITLVVTGVLHAVAVSGGIRPLLSSTYGAALGVKVAVFALMLLLGDRGRRYAGRLARRRVDADDDQSAPAGVQALAVAIGSELTLVLGVLAATAVLVWYAP